eukprot:TRINITY_DN5396_c0_g1_i2.p1 TRINITY_DN5396_c0_g1~~TRINITY_DN5396_c0_g1_i2.p1  ORF type:complete len:650 (+),score=241.19 TRINITY_DN5396_c0_g1_i2:256-2205(+)
MDFMELEREKGITIQSAATYCNWGDHKVNIIDTPGHVDFTIEVERALRVLDGAVLVMCGVAGVQSQTITVDRQMRRYSVPRLVFINKLDRSGADPFKVLQQLRDKLKLKAGLVQLPIGLEDKMLGVVDLVTQEACYNEGSQGERVERRAIPEALKAQTQKYRAELIEMIADADDVIAEKMMEGQEPTVPELKAAIRKATLAHKFTPVLLGTALKNKGIQNLLDAFVDFMPNPMESKNVAIDNNNDEAKVELISDVKKPFVGLAFKLEQGNFGQLTYMRIYQGAVTKGDTIYDVNGDRRVKIPRLVKMHANDKMEINEISAGDICAMFGVDCASGSTFTGGAQTRFTMSSMHVPEPVISLSITTQKKDPNLGKALQRFQKEDPTFRVNVDPESGETIIAGMGELHLEIYVERMRREYKVEATTGRPQVAYRETIKKHTPFEYTHKKQSGGAGQYAKICGYLEPIPLEENVDFVNATIGGSIPPQFISAVEKGFIDAVGKGPLLGQPVTGVRMVVNDGASHSVDSSEMAFRLCSTYAFKECFKNASPAILEPIMEVEILAPVEFQGIVISGINKRKGLILSTDSTEDWVTARAEVPLNSMFGYSTDLRSLTQGKGEFTMEYRRHSPVTKDQAAQLMVEFKKKAEEKKKEQK